MKGGYISNPMSVKKFLQTGQTTCYDTSGREIHCSGSGQDAETPKGISWPVPRFEQQEETVLDRLSGLMWTRNANLAEFPMAWQEALDYLSKMNRDRA